MLDLKLLVLANWQGFYISLIDPKTNPRLCLDMIHPPTKFEPDCSKEIQVIIKKKLMFDARLPARPPARPPTSPPCENLVNNFIE